MPSKNSSANFCLPRDITISGKTNPNQCQWNKSCWSSNTCPNSSSNARVILVYTVSQHVGIPGLASIINLRLVDNGRNLAGAFDELQSQTLGCVPADLCEQHIVSMLCEMKFIGAQVFQLT